MSLHSYIERQINKFNEENKCGFCWEFYAPLTEDAMNKQQLKNNENCSCVHVMMTRDNMTAFGNDYRYNERLGQNAEIFEYKNFKLFFLKRQGMDVNNHIEILDNDTSKSKINFLEELEDCISQFYFDFCDEFDKNWVMQRWQGTQLINYLDNNYTGYRVDVTLRRRVNGRIR